MELYISNDLKHIDMNDFETQASPTMIHMKQKDLKIVIDNTILDEDSPPNSPKHNQEDIEYISQMVEKIKSLAKKKTISGDLWEFFPCHSCRGLLEKKLLVRCVENECSRYFCLRCMNKKFSISCEEIYNIIQLGRWSCFSCEGMCNCKICKNRFSEHQIEYFPKQLIPFDKSKKKSGESPSFRKPEQQQEEISFPSTIERQTSKQSISSIKEVKEPKINNRKWKDDDIRRIRKEARLRAKALEASQEKEKTEKSKSSYKKDSPKIMRTKQSKLRSKILAKQKLKEQKYANNESSSEEEEAKTTVEKPEETQLSQNTDKTDPNRDNKRTLKSSKKPLEECHLCNKMVPGNNVAVCSVDKCRKGFCIPCINENFQQDFTFKSYNADCWICYRCAGVCKCSKCSRKRMPTFKIASDDLIQPADFKRIFNKNLMKRPKFYDPITDDENEVHYHNESETEESEDEEVTANLVLKSLQNKRKRLNKGLDFTNSNMLEGNKELIEA